MTGFTRSPDPNYSRRLGRWLSQLLSHLSTPLTLLTSPTGLPGSLDATVSLAARRHSCSLVYLTCEDYLAYGMPDHPQFHRTLRQAWWADLPRYVWATPLEYARATAHLSNALLVAGGRETAALDLQLALQRGNPCLIWQLPEGLSPPSQAGASLLPRRDSARWGANWLLGQAGISRPSRRHGQHQ